MSDSDNSGTRATSIALRYGLAVSSVAAALVATHLLRPDALVSPVFFLAIILSAWFGGIGPGLVAAVLATLAIAYFFLHPQGLRLADLLENVIERAITLSQGGVITIDDLPPRIRLQESTPPLSVDDLGELFSGLPSLDEIERRYILHVLDATGNNRKRTAELLGINRKTLYRMAARYQIEFDSMPSRPD